MARLELAIPRLQITNLPRYLGPLRYRARHTFKEERDDLYTTVAFTTDHSKASSNHGFDHISYQQEKI